MVSGLVTSPKDQERIFSGEAREILIALKSFSVVGLVAKARVSTLFAPLKRSLDAAGREQAAAAHHPMVRRPRPPVRKSLIQVHLFKSSTSRQRDCSSRTRTLNDSGRPGPAGISPLTIAS